MRPGSPHMIYDPQGRALPETLRITKRDAVWSFASAKGIDWFWLWLAGYRCRETERRRWHLLRRVVG